MSQLYILLHLFGGKPWEFSHHVCEDHTTFQKKTAIINIIKISIQIWQPSAKLDCCRWFTPWKMNSRNLKIIQQLKSGKSSELKIHLHDLGFKMLGLHVTNISPPWWKPEKNRLKRALHGKGYGLVRIGGIFSRVFSPLKFNSEFTPEKRMVSWKTKAFSCWGPR